MLETAVCFVLALALALAWLPREATTTLHTPQTQEERGVTTTPSCAGARRCRLLYTWQRKEVLPRYEVSSSNPALSGDRHTNHHQPERTP